MARLFRKNLGRRVGACVAYRDRDRVGQAEQQILFRVAEAVAGMAHNLQHTH